MEFLKNNKTRIAIVLALLSLGYGAGYFTKPTEVKKEVVEVEKIKVVKQEGKTVEKYKERIVRPDGTIEEREMSKEEWNKQINVDKDRAISQKTETKNDIGLNISALAIAPVKNIKDVEYGVIVKKRIISNVTGSILATEGGKIGIGIGLDF